MNSVLFELLSLHLMTSTIIYFHDSMQMHGHEISLYFGVKRDFKGKCGEIILKTA